MRGGSGGRLAAKLDGNKHLIACPEKSWLLRCTLQPLASEVHEQIKPI